jgi:hypothetical protein
MRDRLPEKISLKEGGFGYFTLTRRLPDIVDRIIATGGISADREGLLRALLSDMLENRPLDAGVFTRTGPFWSEFLAGVDGCRWQDLSFFDMEFLFYHGVNSIAGYYENAAADPFRVMKREANEEAVKNFWTSFREDSLGGSLADALYLATFANEIDLSYRRENFHFDAGLWSGRILRDDSDGYFTRPVPEVKAVSIILDNAGAELLADLCLAAKILSLYPDAEVTLHAKKAPMFVSDATSADVRHMLDVAGAADKAARKEFSGHIGDGRLQVREEDDWSEPRFFDNLSDGLESRLAGADLVIAKGDLNYRRFTGDRAWPPQTPAGEAARGLGFSALCLRVLKSEAVVGLEPAVVRKLAGDRDWMTRGYYGVLQAFRTAERTE